MASLSHSKADPRFSGEMKSLHTDLAYRFIREKILSGEYAPGRSLAMENLAIEIRVSRTPIRDALRMLETDGLVTILARAGASVREMTPGELRELSDLRLALESHASGLAAVHRGAQDLAGLRMLLEEEQSLAREEGEGGIEESSPAKRAYQDLRIHQAVVEASHNDLLAKEVARLHLIIRIFGRPTSSESIEPARELATQVETEVAAHQAIFRAIASRKGAAAKAAMAAHLQTAIDRQFNPRAHAFTPDELACMY